MPWCWASRTRKLNGTNMPQEKQNNPRALRRKGPSRRGRMKAFSSQGFGLLGIRFSTVKMAMSRRNKKRNAHVRIAHGKPTSEIIRVTIILLDLVSSIHRAKSENRTLLTVASIRSEKNRKPRYQTLAPYSSRTTSQLGRCQQRTMRLLQERCIWTGQERTDNTSLPRTPSSGRRRAPTFRDTRAAWVHNCRIFCHTPGYWHTSCSSALHTISFPCKKLAERCQYGLLQT